MSRFGIQPPIDWAHLDRATLSDRGLADEVLGLFAAQAAEFAASFHGSPADAARLVHTLKGSARGIGAWRVADSAETLEAVWAASGDPRPAVAALFEQVADARHAIAAHRDKA